MTKVQGLEKTLRGIKAAEKDYQQAVAKAVFSEAQKILTDAKILVPRITGNLANSGRVTKKTGDDVEAVISFGGVPPNGLPVPYAMRVHEEPRPPSSNGTYKYLETPFKEASAGYAARIRDRAKGYLKGGD